MPSLGHLEDPVWRYPHWVILRTLFKDAFLWRSWGPCLKIPKKGYLEDPVWRGLPWVILRILYKDAFLGRSLRPCLKMPSLGHLEDPVWRYPTWDIWKTLFEDVFLGLGIFWGPSPDWGCLPIGHIEDPVWSRPPWDILRSLFEDSLLEISWVFCLKVSPFGHLGPCLKMSFLGHQPWLEMYSLGHLKNPVLRCLSLDISPRDLSGFFWKRL